MTAASGLLRRFNTYQRQSKARLNAPSAVLGLPFLFVLILPGRRRTLNLQTYCLAAALGVRHYAPARSLQLRPSVGLHACKMPSSFTVLSSFLVSAGLFGFVQSRPLATWSPLAITLRSCCFVVLRLDKASLAQPYCVIASNTSSVAGRSSGACFAQLIIILH